MKTFEKILLFLFIVVVISTIFDVAGASFFLAIVCIVLQVTYLLGAWYFFAIAATPNTPKYNNLIFSIIVGMLLSSCVYAITASILHWTPNTIITPTLTVSFIVVFPFTIYKMLNSKTTNKIYYQNILLRSACLGALAVMYVLFFANDSKVYQ